MAERLFPSEIEVEPLGDLMLDFLINRDREDTFIDFKETLSIAKDSPFAKVAKDILAQINQRNFDEGIPNLLRAFDEDKLLLGEAKARQQLAFRVKEGLIDFTCRVIDNNWLPGYRVIGSLPFSSTADIIGSLDEVEQLFLGKIINSAKLVQVHDDIYTKLVMFDNLKDLCLLIETNLRRRSGIDGILPKQVIQNFASEPWVLSFRKETRQGKNGLTGYSGVNDFESKLQTIKNSKPAIGSVGDFELKNFLTATLVRNFTAHYVDEKLKLLSSAKEYQLVFSMVIYVLFKVLASKIP